MGIRDLDFRPMWTLPLLLLTGAGSMGGRWWAAPVAVDTRPATITMAADAAGASRIDQAQAQRLVACEPLLKRPAREKAGGLPTMWREPA
jgi:hypothetical protein